MTREQAIRHAVERTAAERRQHVVVVERFARHKPSYRVLDGDTWDRMRRLRAEGRAYTNWAETWPVEEEGDGLP